MERDTAVEIAVSVGAVGLFVAAVLGVGAVYDGAGSFPRAGALALVGVIFGFVAVMTGVGYFLANRQ